VVATRFVLILAEQAAESPDFQAKQEKHVLSWMKPR